MTSTMNVDAKQASRIRFQRIINGEKIPLSVTFHPVDINEDDDDVSAVSWLTSLSQSMSIVTNNSNNSNKEGDPTVIDREEGEPTVIDRERLRYAKLASKFKFRRIINTNSPKTKSARKQIIKKNQLRQHENQEPPSSPPKIITPSLGPRNPSLSAVLGVVDLSAVLGAVDEDGNQGIENQLIENQGIEQDQQHPGP